MKLARHYAEEAMRDWPEALLDSRARDLMLEVAARAARAGDR
jgi:hypothetical protein